MTASCRGGVAFFLLVIKVEKSHRRQQKGFRCKLLGSVELCDSDVIKHDLDLWKQLMLFLKRALSVRTSLQTEKVS